MNGFIHAFRGKDENAHAVIDTYMDYCAKRWQAREGTYQLKRPRLLPDVRDPPEQGDEEVDMTDIWSFAWMAWRTYYRWDERLWGARGFHPFCEDFHRLFLCVVVWVCVVWLWFCFAFFAGEMTPACNSCFTFFAFAFVDRPCPVLARQCRKKTNSSKGSLHAHTALNQWMAGHSTQIRLHYCFLQSHYWRGLTRPCLSQQLPRARPPV